MILQLRSRYSYSIFNSLFYEEPDLGDNMAGEEQSYLLTYFIILYTSK